MREHPAVGSNPTSSAKRYGAFDVDNLWQHAEFVKGQMEFHLRQADRFAEEPRRATLHATTAAQFRLLLEGLDALHAWQEANPGWESAHKIDRSKRLALSWDEIEGLPPELLAELSLSESDRTEFNILSSVRELGGVASLDRLLVYIYRQSGEVMKRTALNQRLYRMIQKELLHSVPGKKGVMNKLPLAKRVQILSMLVEGSSCRSISRVADVSLNTVYKTLIDAGKACVRFHDETVRNVASKRIQCDEAWSFCYAKQKNVATAKAAPEGAGDVWTWTALDSDTKLILSWQVGGRDAEYALALMDDLRSRLANRVQLTTDGHKAYLSAVEEAFGADIDYGMLVKLYGPEISGQGHERKYSPSECLGARKDTITGNPDPKHISTSHTAQSLCERVF